MKRLFLCSSFADVANLLIDFANEDLKGKIIAFIPTASLTEPIRFYVKKSRLPNCPKRKYLLYYTNVIISI